jgi:hypothetical protein
LWLLVEVAAVKLMVKQAAAEELAVLEQVHRL